MARGHDHDKLVRDSYTIPRDEYRAIEVLKARGEALATARPKKSELLRAGLMLLARQSDAQFKRALLQVPRLETGRPKSKAVDTVASTAKVKTAKPPKPGKSAKPGKPAKAAPETQRAHKPPTP